MSSPIYELKSVPEEDIAALEKFFGGPIPARVSLGKRPAVLVVDMVEAFVRDEYPTGWAATGEPCLRAIDKLLGRARELAWPVIFTRSESTRSAAEVGAWARGRDLAKVFPFDTPEEMHEIASEIEVMEDDIVITKAKPSAFFGTQLSSILTSLGCDSLVITGMVTSGCIRATVNDAFSLNYPVVLPFECVADRSQTSHEVSLFDMGAKYADLVRLEDVLQFEPGADH